ncbi:XLF domain-containing protein [Pyrenophora tritici-repentis]|nr:XLF domain-containing protein [Pyrenophora tritici-repentis]
MSCWRVLKLSDEPGDKQVPQLLIKPAFHSDSYILHLTDLSNIWSEESDLDGIVNRASQEQSPIEVSKQDTAQLSILLHNIKKSLVNDDDAVCQMTRIDGNGITLHTSICLPEPLDRLTWKFYLKKRPSTVLENELILPLLVSSHIQHERINRLITTINSKDNAITRLADHFDSNNMDFAAAFPSIGGTKSGKRMIKREQAAKHIPALQSFREDAWRQETEQLRDSDVTTLGLFQEALAHSTPDVPIQLKSGDREQDWWTAVPTHLSSKTAAKRRTMSPPPIKPNDVVAGSSDEETEDEFENHEHFNTHTIATKPAEIPVPTPSSSPNGAQSTSEDSTEDEDDLDVPPMNGSQSQGRALQTSPGRKPSPKHSPLHKATDPPAAKTKVNTFRIGGKSKALIEPPPSATIVTGTDTHPDDLLPTRESVPPCSPPTQTITTLKKARKPFKIGGKGKDIDRETSQSAFRARQMQSPTVEPPSFPPLHEAVREPTPIKEVIEETPEEKAERRRAELKRKNGEAAKKLAQAKKKKRF